MYVYASGHVPIYPSTLLDDATRVHLREGPDYINANFVNVWQLLCDHVSVCYRAKGIDFLCLQTKLICCFSQGLAFLSPLPCPMCFLSFDLPCIARIRGLYVPGSLPCPNIYRFCVFTVVLISVVYVQLSILSLLISTACMHVHLMCSPFPLQLEVETTGQIVSYIASQGPMQHTCKDFWQVNHQSTRESLNRITPVIRAQLELAGFCLH